MNPYTFRIDDKDADGKSFTGYDTEVIKTKIELFLLDQSLASSKYIIAYEKSDKKGKYHFQGIVWSPLKHSTYQKLCYKFFPEWKSEGKRGNKAGLCSFAEVKNVDSYTVYTTKDYHFTYISGYTDDEIEALHKRSYHKVSKAEGLKVNGDKKEFETILFEMYKSLPQSAIEWDPVEVSMFVDNYYLVRGKYPIEHFAKALVKGLYIMIDRRQQNLRKAKVGLRRVEEWWTPPSGLCDDQYIEVRYKDSVKVVEWDPIEDGYYDSDGEKICVDKINADETKDSDISS